MNIAVLSDTHGHLDHTEAAVCMLKELDIDLVLHCGDIGSPEIVSLFEEWPTHFVFGNCDGDEKQLEKAIEEAQQNCHGEFGEFELEGREIAILHSHDHDKFEEVVQCGHYDLVCYGHTHQQGCYKCGKTLILNPGALYRAKPLTFAVVKLPTLEVEYHVVPV